LPILIEGFEVAGIEGLLDEVGMWNGETPR
jgi:hypothetical protein